MNEKNWKEWALIFGMFGLVQWFILIHIAMLFYAGGTMVNPNSPGYNYWTNWLSDLGRTKGYSGKDNTISMTIHTITLNIYGFSYIIIGIVVPNILKENRLEKRLSIIGSFFIIIYGISTMGEAFAHWDTYYEAHMAFSEIMGITSLFASIFYTIVFFHNEEFPRRIAYSFIVVLLTGIIGSVILSLYGIWPPTTTEELMVFTVEQKIRTFISLPFIFYIYYSAWKKIKT